MRVVSREEGAACLGQTTTETAQSFQVFYGDSGWMAYISFNPEPGTLKIVHKPWRLVLYLATALPSTCDWRNLPGSLGVPVRTMTALRCSLQQAYTPASL